MSYAYIDDHLQIAIHSCMSDDNAVGCIIVHCETILNNVVWRDAIFRAADND